MSRLMDALRTVDDQGASFDVQRDPVALTITA